MRGLDYRSVVSEPPDLDSGARAYVLQLGSTELEPISYATLLTLREYGAAIGEVLGDCFVDKPVLWADPSEVNEGSYGEQLHEIEASLSAFNRRFGEARLPSCTVLARIVGAWRELTLEVLREFVRGAGSELGASTESILIDYRRSAFAFVEALLQMLPDEDRCSIEARARLEEGRAQLANSLHVGPEHLGEAGWRKTEATGGNEDTGFVTWGIP